MQQPQYLSTNQVSEALGVSVSTVKRWVDEGILPAHKTAGGHRKLLLADVLRLVHASDFPRLDLTRLQAASSAADPRSLRQDLQAALRSGNAAGVRAAVRGAYQSGVGMAVLADEVIAPAVNQLGHDWEAGRVEVFHEHRGIQLCQSALFELMALLESQAQKSRPTAVGGAPEMDYYILPSLLAQMVLLDAGWEPVNLGPHTPMSSFTRAIREHRPRLIWLSASHLVEPRAFLKEYADFYHQAEKAGVAVVVGGQALTEKVRADMKYTSFGDRLGILAAFAQTLCPFRRKPRRGRPPASPG
jgi:excisionase family DNA binding protein